MKKIISSLILLLPIIFSVKSRADVIDVNGIRWPIPNWNIAIDQQEIINNKQCRQFINFAMNSKSFLTEGIVIIKDGELKYEKYEGKYTNSTPHVLWSISKTITGALLGIAVRDNRVSLEQYLYEFYPLLATNENYQKIKIENLFYLDTGFIWDEFYIGDVRKSPVLNMLYGNGHRDIVNFAINKKIISEGPNFKWDYTTGTPAITMGVLKNIYNSDYNKMPWVLFFNLLNMKSITFEQDLKGVFNGGSSVFATPRDVAKIGYLYLNNGEWNGQTILPKEWLEKTLKVSPGYLSNGTVVHNITNEGVYGGSIWLNRIVKKGFGKPYPTSPENMFLALGHYGQMMIVLPTQKMVIVRTGHDQEYISKIDEFVSRAISCFDDHNYPIGKNIPAPANSNPSITKIFKTLKSSLQTNMMQAAVAKIICSCHFVSGLDIETCLERSNIPLANLLTNIVIVKNKVFSNQSKIAKLFIKIFGLKESETAEASFDQAHPEFGCTLR